MRSALTACSIASVVVTAVTIPARPAEARHSGADIHGRDVHGLTAPELPLAQSWYFRGHSVGYFPDVAAGNGSWRGVLATPSK